jgi:hypothetical protein
LTVADSRNPRSPKHPSDADKAKGRASVERAMALRDVMSHAVEVEKEVRKSSAPPGAGGAGRTVMLTLSLGLLAFTVFAYTTKPEFIFGADPTKVPEVRRDANLRFTMYLLSLRVESFRDSSKRLPDDLSVIVGAPKGVAYARISDSLFELRARDGAKEIVFRSDEPANRFLGESPKILAGRGQ